MGILKRLEDALVILFKPNVWVKKQEAELESIFLKHTLKPEEAQKPQPVKHDELVMGWHGASKVFSNLAEVKPADIFQDITIVKKMQTVKNFLFNEEEYEKSYVTNRLNSEGKISIANAYLSQKKQQAKKISSHSMEVIHQEVHKKTTSSHVKES